MYYCDWCNETIEHNTNAVVVRAFYGILVWDKSRPDTKTVSGSKQPEELQYHEKCWIAITEYEEEDKE